MSPETYVSEGVESTTGERKIISTGLTSEEKDKERVSVAEFFRTTEMEVL